MMKKLMTLTGVFALFLAAVAPAFAHVTVSPKEAGVGERVNFVVSVPTEEDVPTTQVRLIIPEGLTSVRPNVKPGWDIQIVRTGDGEDARVSEIIWSGGSIPAEQRDEFVFRAMAPAEEAAVAWKAYQTYASSKVVAWDADPKVVEEYTKKNPPKEGEHDDKAPKPYSETQVINDLKVSPTGGNNMTEMSSGSTEMINLLLFMSGAALILSIAAIYLQMRKK